MAIDINGYYRQYFSSPQGVKYMYDLSAWCNRTYEEMKKDGHPRAVIVFNLLRNLDESIQELTKDQKISCKKGCAYCCYERAAALPVEGELAVNFAIQKGWKIDVDRIKEQAKYDTGNDTWLKAPYEVRKCVFLKDDNTCAIYEARPIACREYMVNTPPSKCNTEFGRQPIQMAVLTPSRAMQIWLQEKTNQKPTTLQKYLYDNRVLIESHMRQK